MKTLVLITLAGAAFALSGCTAKAVEQPKPYGSEISAEAAEIMARTEQFHKFQLGVKIASEKESAFVQAEVEKCKKKDPTKPTLILTPDQFLVCGAEKPADDAGKKK